MIYANEDIGDAFELLRHLGDNVIRQVRVVIVGQELCRCISNVLERSNGRAHLLQRIILAKRQNFDTIEAKAEVEIADMFRLVMPLRIPLHDGKPFFDRFASSRRTERDTDRADEDLAG